MNQHIKLTVGDLLEEREGTFVSDRKYHGRMIALSGADGKKLFDTRNNKIDYIASKFFDREIQALWTEIRPTSTHNGYTTFYEPVLMAYI